MLKTIALTFAAGLLAQTGSPAVEFASPGASFAVADVAATVETVPVSSAGDAADDPAVWVNPSDPAKSLVIGTDKRSGLVVYDLAGATLQTLAAGRLNNVDLRDGFRLKGAAVALVTSGNRAGDTIAIYALDPATRRLRDVAARTIKTAAAYGSCMYRSAKTGAFYYFLANKAGVIEQWELFERDGMVDAKRVREMKLGGQLEGCVADDELGVLYVGEEATGVWRFSAEPDGPATGALVAKVGPTLVPDVEGIAIAKTGATSGYLIVSSQGNSTFAVFRRDGDNAYLRSFRVVDGGGVDGVSDTDGLDVTTAALGSAFPKGLLIVQDGTNDGANQNFKFVPLERVLP